jgi:hypothetical protein
VLAGSWHGLRASAVSVPLVCVFQMQRAGGARRTGYFGGGGAGAIQGASTHRSSGKEISADPVLALKKKLCSRLREERISADPVLALAK